MIKNRIDALYHSEEILVKDFDQIKDANEMAQALLNLEFLKGVLTEQQISIIKTRGLLTAFYGQTEKKEPNGQDYW